VQKRPSCKAGIDANRPGAGAGAVGVGVGSVAPVQVVPVPFIAAYLISLAPLRTLPSFFSEFNDRLFTAALIVFRKSSRDMRNVTILEDLHTF
jgi:hypothetical protein